MILCFTLLNTFGSLHSFQGNSGFNSRNRLFILVSSNLPNASVMRADDFLFLAVKIVAHNTDSLYYSELFFDFKNANYVGINNYLADFDCEWLNGLSINEAVNVFIPCY